MGQLLEIERVLSIVRRASAPGEGDAPVRAGIFALHAAPAYELHGFWRVLTQTRDPYSAFDEPVAGLGSTAADRQFARPLDLPLRSFGLADLF